MRLLPGERRRLDLIEDMLRAEAPDLASKFDMFTRLARGEGKPPAERPFWPDGAWQDKAFARHRARLYCWAVPALVVAALVVLVTIELT